eukprot:scaffold25532_cov94-Skeletonema_dohrnii-CCMP3373.AAC.1
MKIRQVKSTHANYSEGYTATEPHHSHSDTRRRERKRKEKGNSLSFIRLIPYLASSDLLTQCSMKRRL